MRRSVVAWLLRGAALVTASVPATAAPPAVTVPTDANAFESGQAGGGPFDFLDNLQRSSFLLGDMWGLRTQLSQYGLSLGVLETSELLGNPTGGIRKGAEYDGLTQAVLQMDTQRAFDWYGGLLNISGLQNHGRDLTGDNLGAIQTVSSIAADRATRLWELWYQQKFLVEDRLDIKIGQQSLDQEFMVNPNALLFVNTAFGWPTLPSADMPGGGPVAPLSALGARLRVRPINALTIMAGVFNGSPVANNQGDPQRQNPSGTSFPIAGGALAIAELQYTYPAIGNFVYPDDTESLARIYRIGIWYDSENFDDQRFDNGGLSLANPASSGIPRTHRGDFAVYAAADQMVWIYDKDYNRNISVFGRVTGTPEQDRNLIDLSMNAGFVLHQPLNYRNDDTFGIGIGYAHVSRQAAELDKDTAAFTSAFTPARRSETYLEATYLYQALAWWQVQPDIQYVIDPGAGIANPNDPTKRVGNELVIGLRTNILF
jgi:porin